MSDTPQSPPDEDISVAVGRSLSRHRATAGMTLSQLSAASEVSAAMISRIEHGQVAPSLSTIQALARALKVPLVSLFEQTLETADIHFTKAGEGLHAQRIAPGHAHDYLVLGAHRNQALDFEAVQVDLSADDNGTHPQYFSYGFVFITITSGEITYACGDQNFEMRPGDSISFDARLRHGVASVQSPAASFTSVSAKLV